MSRLTWVVLALVVALLMAAVLTASCPEPPVHPHIGGWARMTWKGATHGPAHFHPGGEYEVEWGGTRWVGTWTLESGSLRVREWVETTGDPARPLCWDVVMDRCGTRGGIGEMVFVLER